LLYVGVTRCRFNLILIQVGDANELLPHRWPLRRDHSMTDASDIHAIVTEKQITRLCHFTPFRNLLHIAREGKGVLSTRRLEADERAVFNQTDLQRMDGRPDYVCCSIEYPNTWYFRTARANEPLFKGWVVLIISPKYLWSEGTLFSTGNAAAGRGVGLASGRDALLRLYAPTVVGTGNRQYVTSITRLPACPTDEQAEVLIKDGIESNDIVGVGVASEKDARGFLVALELAGATAWDVPSLSRLIFFKPEASAALCSVGIRLPEILLSPSKLRAT
jgi:hypothetical protein